MAGAVMGVAAHPESTLVDRVLVRLRGGPEKAAALCRDVLGLPSAPTAVCDRLVVALLGADPRVRQLQDGRWAIVPEAQGSPLLEECAFAVVDVETTGMRPTGADRITEIAIAVVCGGRADVAFQSLVNPERPIPSVVSSVTGITDDMVRAAPTFDAIADQVVSVLAGRVFVAHNARFDWGFVSAELRRARALTLEGPKLCTVRLARRLVKGVRSCGLDNLTRVFGLDNAARHRAAGDAQVTAELLRRLIALAREDGARTLQDLAAIETRSTGTGRRRRRATPTGPQADSCPEETT
jgi:DNA polymerase III epsilon subunit family exonuclease